jgi:hypothetical protein
MENTKATETEREITSMVKARGLDPAAWCWVGVDNSGMAFAYNKKPRLIDGIYYENCPPFEYVGTIKTTEPQLFKFNPFYDNEEQN